MCPNTYWPPTVFQVILERWQSCLELLGVIVFFALVDVWQKRRRLGRLTDNRRDLVLTCLAYGAVWAGLFVGFFVSLIWDDALNQHEDAALESCSRGFQAVYQAYQDAEQVQTRLVILAVMFLALAALFTILRGVVADGYRQRAA